MGAVPHILELPDWRWLAMLCGFAGAYFVLLVAVLYITGITDWLFHIACNLRENWEVAMWLSIVSAVLVYGLSHHFGWSV